jgi:hypothetical protein
MEKTGNEKARNCGSVSPLPEEHAQKIHHGWKRFWLVCDIFFFGVYFLYFFAILDPAGVIAYSDGLNGTSYSFALILILINYWFLTLLFFMVLAVRMVYWGRTFKSQKNPVDCTGHCNRLQSPVCDGIASPIFGTFSFFKGVSLLGHVKFGH